MTGISPSILKDADYAVELQMTCGNPNHAVYSTQRWALKVAVFRFFFVAIFLFYESNDKQAKLVLLKNSFSRRYSYFKFEKFDSVPSPLKS